ncbi:MAG: hypothetical protein LBR80_18540 [Deltaproteobacteria bacterium]|nr:hypothetical protein [Deltaproteobacteria bacterium]
MDRYFVKADDVYDFSLLPEYGEKTRKFSGEERKIKSRGFGPYFSEIGEDARYYEAGRFRLDGLLYRLIIYRHEGFGDVTALTFQLNSYGNADAPIDAVVLDSLWAFEEAEFSRWFRVSRNAIEIVHYVTFIAEIVDGGDIGDPIEKPYAQPYRTERYRIDKGRFELLLEVDFPFNVPGYGIKMF